MCRRTSKLLASSVWVQYGTLGTLSPRKSVTARWLSWDPALPEIREYGDNEKVKDVRHDNLLLSNFINAWRLFDHTIVAPHRQRPRFSFPDT